jgi:hypothetical protein
VKEIDMGQRRKETVYVMATELHTSHSVSGKIFNILWAASPVQVMIDQNQCVEHFGYLGSTTTQDPRSTWGIKCRTAIAKAAINMRLFSRVIWPLIQHRK